MKKLNLFSKFAAVGVAGVSVIALTSFAPAQAVVLGGISGELEFDDGTTNFFEDVTPGAGDSFSLTFSPAGLASSFGASGDFAPFFPSVGTYPLTPATATFDWVSGGPSTFIYSLRNDLVFAFDNGVSVSFDAGSGFLGSFDKTGSVIDSVGFEELDGVRAKVSIPGISSFSVAEELTFGDLPGGNIGEYGVVVQTAVPEPLTILGTGMAFGFGTFFKKKRGSSAA